MCRLAACLALCLSLSAPALAGQDGIRLVPGGVSAPQVEQGRFSGRDHKAEVFHAGNLRLGALLDSTPATDGTIPRTALGGFADYGLGDGFSLMSSMRSDDVGSMADFSARVMGSMGTAAVTLGYGWTGGAATFSLNPWQRAGVLEPVSSAQDWSLSLNFSRDLGTAFSLEGFAAATRSEYEDHTTQQGFRLGAGFGYRF